MIAAAVFSAAVGVSVFAGLAVWLLRSITKAVNDMFGGT